MTESPELPRSIMQPAADQLLLSDHQQQAIRALCNDFPAVWNNPATPDRERKRKTMFKSP